MDPGAQAVGSILAAYRAGYFPMAESARGDGPIHWLSPDPRAIIPLDGFHVPRSLRKRVRSSRFGITTDHAFEAVIRACAEPRPHERDTWIDERIVSAYTALHRAGHAHSIEAWCEGRPVGGLYGVHIGGAFFAESKFSRPAEGGTDASKVCLVHLVQHLRRRGFMLLDVQMTNPHLEQFGVIEVPRTEYLAMLGAAVQRRAEWLPFGSQPPA
ncbi:MAG: leucyl/phenylalanyl-tRNA--protein transferase [Phycisphaerales bacterium]|nr:leucyl/phenylalanyl-tRNA--protein transferase [Phycisphaerales bacterium]